MAGETHDLIRVTVLLPGVLRPDADGLSTFALDVAGRPVVADFLDALAERYPRLARRVRDERGEVRRYVNVFVDGHEHRAVGGLDAPLRPDSEIYLLQSVAGG